MRSSKFKVQSLKFKVTAILLSTLYSLLLLVSCSKQDKIYRESRIAMDTVCTITVVSSSEKEAKEAVEAGFAEIKRLEGLLNFFSEDSEVTAINRASGHKPVKVSADVRDIIEKAVKISEQTSGAFDPTVGPLMRLWGFSNKNAASDIPQTDKIKSLLPLIDYKKIKIDNSILEILLGEKGMELDLGGIAKGYAADRVTEVIKAKGIKAALVSIAGDIKGFGLKPDKKQWRVGIQNPRAESGGEGQSRTASPGEAGGAGRKNEEDVFAAVDLHDNAISTSGDYQRFFIKDGKRYHHILNPKTGFPASDVMSVSVIAPQGCLADGLSTGVFVLGAEKGIKLLESMGLSGIIMDANKKVFLTKNLKGKVHPVRKLDQ